MIGVLVPYRGLAGLVAEVKGEIPEPVEVVPARVIDAAAVGKRLVRAGATVLVARGGTAESLRNEIGGLTAIVEILITAHDVLRAVAKGMKKAPHVCLMAYPNMIEGVDETASVFGIHIQVVRISPDTDISRSLTQVGAADGDVCFVGGAITCEMAKACGYPSVLIESGREAVSFALKEASRIAQVQEIEAEKRYRLRAVLDSMEDGIIVTDARGTPEIWNTEAARRFQAETAREGKDLPVSVLKQPIGRCIETGLAEDSLIRLPSGAQSVASVRPVAADHKARGVLISLRDAVRVEALEHKVRRDVHSLGLTAKMRFSDIVGKSEMLRGTVARADAFASIDATVLILGESGVGKEVYAQAIHNASARRNGPYVAINCAALPETLLESELFGYASGAFTGATKEGKPGLFELAHQGTLLLDEVSELSQSLQGKLLRVLQERQVRRVGGDRVIPVDVRIIAASNRDLQGMVVKGQFREDLFFRLDVLRLNIPPLRVRPEDVETIFDHFVASFSQELKLPSVRLNAESAGLLSRYSWPGNIREVQNVVQRCLALYGGQVLTPDDINTVLSPDSCFQTMMRDQSIRAQNTDTADQNNVSDDEVRRVLDACGGSVSKAAKMLGVHRTTVWRRLRGVLR